MLSYLVSQRTRELGIRVAVGAGPGEIVRLILGRGLGLALVASLLPALRAMRVDPIVALRTE